MTKLTPYPSSTEDDDPSVKRGVAGCLIGGGLGVVGLTLAAFAIGALLIAGLGSCEFEVGKDKAGTDSERLPVAVTPPDGLVDGQVVTVSSDAFEPNQIIGVGVCLSEADTESQGAAACDQTQGARFATDRTGHLEATYAVPRQVRTGGTVTDCGEAPERCLLVAAYNFDYDISGGQPISFDPAGPAPATPPTTRAVSAELPIGASTPGPYAPDAEVTLLASGFQPGEPLITAWCTSELQDVGVADACEPVDLSAAIGAVMGFDVDPDGLTANEAGAVAMPMRAIAGLTPYGTEVEMEPGDDEDPPPPPAVDCAAAAGTCSFVISAAADTQRSAVLPYELMPS